MLGLLHTCRSSIPGGVPEHGRPSQVSQDAGNPLNFQVEARHPVSCPSRQVPPDRQPRQRADPIAVPLRCLFSFLLSNLVFLDVASVEKYLRFSHQAEKITHDAQEPSAMGEPIHSRYTTACTPNPAS